MNLSLNLFRPFCLILALTGSIVSSEAQTIAGKATPLVPDAKGWISLMDGKSLSGWMTFDPHAWSIDEEGLLVGKGARSHLFSP
ncbi:MAG: hypothetical protein VYE74_09300, partial [Verrucomicrobiota bacterium]|nr:hypothetical protein [Verrucomicrobiota bacterium]